MSPETQTLLDKAAADRVTYETANDTMTKANADAAAAAAATAAAKDAAIASATTAITAVTKELAL